MNSTDILLTSLSIPFIWVENFGKILFSKTARLILLFSVKAERSATIGRGLPRAQPNYCASRFLTLASITKCNQKCE
jgi:hypothetical protein